MAKKNLEKTYSTQAEADTFVRTFNLYIDGGRTAECVRVGAGQYQVWIEECPSWQEHFFGQFRMAA